MTPITFRSAEPDDFAFCERLYFECMGEIIQKLGLDQAKQVEIFSRQWDLAQVRMVQLEFEDIGWLQTRLQDGSIFLAQLYLGKNFQRRGFGTGIIHFLIEEAARDGRDLTLAVVKINPAVRLYARLGFHTTHEDEYKFYMRRKAGMA